MSLAPSDETQDASPIQLTQNTPENYMKAVMHCLKNRKVELQVVDRPLSRHSPCVFFQERSPYPVYGVAVVDGEGNCLVGYFGNWKRPTSQLKLGPYKDSSIPVKIIETLQAQGVGEENIVEFIPVYRMVQAAENVVPIEDVVLEDEVEKYCSLFGE